MSTKPPSNWFGRNWKWFVPTLFIGVVVLMVGVLAMFVTTLFGFMKSSDVYKEALARSKTSPAVVRALGSPVKDGFFFTGNINVASTSSFPGTNTSTGNANLQIPISGPRGKAVIYAVAKKANGKWTFQKLTVIIKSTGEKIDLLSPAKGSLTSLRQSASPLRLCVKNESTKNLLDS